MDVFVMENISACSEHLSILFFYHLYFFDQNDDFDKKKFNTFRLYISYFHHLLVDVIFILDYGFVLLLIKNQIFAKPKLSSSAYFVHNIVN